MASARNAHDEIIKNAPQLADPGTLPRRQRISFAHLRNNGMGAEFALPGTEYFAALIGGVRRNALSPLALIVSPRMSRCLTGVGHPLVVVTHDRCAVGVDGGAADVGADA